MVMRNISEAKAELSSLLEAVQRGDDVIIAKAGKPIARIVKYGGATQRRVPGALEGRIRIAPDFVVLPDEIAEAFGMTEPRG
jgi:antitoxin (DNA-binding transcriptional repressor) of toxin-antitoxin stability system